MKKKIAILTSGKSRGSNFAAIAEFLHNKSIPVEIAFIVVTRKNAPVIQKAEQYGIKAIFISTKEMPAFEKKLLLLCTKHGVDLIALAGFLKKLSSSFIESFGKPVLNIHPALLPAYGGHGMYGQKVHEAVFNNRDKISGVTVHYINEEYDAGKIIVQEKVSIEDCQSPDEIAQKVLKLEHKIYAPAICKVLGVGY